MKCILEMVWYCTVLVNKAEDKQQLHGGVRLQNAGIYALILVTNQTIRTFIS